MSGKNQFPFILNWQSVDPRTNFLPTPANQSGSVPSGTLGGVMASTNVIYSQIVEVSRMDNIGLEVNWTGTPMGTLEIWGSNSAKNWYPLTFAFTNPSGSASGELLGLGQYPYKYLLLIYTNASGSGVLTVYGQAKDLN